MPGLVPGIHVFLGIETNQDVDGRDKPGHDGSTLRVQSHLAPGLRRRIATEFDTVVQAERAVVPELETAGLNAPAAPARRARHLADDVFCGVFGNLLLEGETVSSGRDCLLAQAPSCACFGRVAK